MIQKFALAARWFSKFTLLEDQIYPQR